MTKLCSVCNAENRDDAQFCRSCGTAFPGSAPSAATADDAQLAAGIVCDECGFQNKPGVRYCANCGVSLLGTVIVPRSRSGPAPDPYAEPTSPPPISYPSFAPVAPYPPAPAAAPMYPPVGSTSFAPPPPPGYPPAYDDPLPVPDVPLPGVGIAASHMREANGSPPSPQPFGAPTATGAAARSGRVGLIVGAVVVVLIAAGAGGWWFMGSSRSASEPAPAASAPVLAAPANAVAPTAGDSNAAALAPAVAPTAGLPEAPAASAEAAIPVPAEAPPPAEPAPPVNASVEEQDAHRLAMQKRREKAAHEKAERAAKVLADQKAAAARADQDAARRRAEEAQRARVASPPPAAVVAAPPPPPKPRSVQEICAGRGLLGESVCQSRECGSPAHVGEAICKKLKDADERRRNLLN